PPYYTLFPTRRSSDLGAGLITFLLIFLYNYYYEIQGDKKTELIWKNYSIAAELKETFKSKIEKHEWYFKKSSEYFNLDNYNSTEKWWAHNEYLIKVDSIKIKWLKFNDYCNNIGFTSPESFEKFIKSNSLNEEEMRNKNKYELIHKEIDSLVWEREKLERKRFTFDQQIDLSKKIIIILFLLIFILRYIIYGVKWSINILKLKND